MASEAERRNSSPDGDQEDNSRSMKMKNNMKRKFDIDSLIKIDREQSSPGPSYRRKNRSPQLAQDYSKPCNQSDYKPTMSAKRSCEDEVLYSASRISPYNEQNSYFTTSANVSKYNVLQVLQPTSARTVDCSCTIQQTSGLDQSTINIDQRQNANLIAHPPLNFSPSEPTQYQDPKQTLTDASLETTPELSTLMPSLTALDTFPMFNWCAKCNASFRMTSDLVHHMRTHHKRRRTCDNM